MLTLILLLGHRMRYYCDCECRLVPEVFGGVPDVVADCGLDFGRMTEEIEEEATRMKLGKRVCRDAKKTHREEFVTQHTTHTHTHTD